MARITIDDCLKIIPNRFDLTLCATVRARQLSGGAEPMVEANRDKATVIALRELAAGKYGIDLLSRRRTDAQKVPSATSSHEDAWRLITDTTGETPKEKVVSSEPA